MFFDAIKKYALILCLLFPIISQANHSKQYYTVDGYSMYVDIEGKGKPAVIFEAGLGWDSPTWKDVAPEVAQFTQSVVYDRIGLGKSSLLKQKEPVTAKQVVSRLKKLLSAANIAPPYILVGQSIGGLYMQLFAREYPKDVKGLILIDSVGQNDPFQDSLPDSSAPYFLEAKGVSISKEQIREAGPFPNIPVIILAAGIHKWATEKEQRQLLFEQKKLLALSPHSELIIVKNSGHYIQNEQPEVVIQAIHSIWIKVKP